MTGMVGSKWDFERFAAMEAIPTSVYLTTYAGSAEDFVRTPLQDFVSEVEAGHSRVKVGRVLRLDEIVEAHRVMEENRAEGRIERRRNKESELPFSERLCSEGEKKSSERFVRDHLRSFYP